MIDHEAELKKSANIQKNREAARENGHIVTIRVEAGATGPLLYIGANHPVRVEVTGHWAGWFMEGGAVDRYPGECKIGEVMIEDLARQGVTELVLDDDGDRKIVLPIPPFEGPAACPTNARPRRPQ